MVLVVRGAAVGPYSKGSAIVTWARGRPVVAGCGLFGSSQAGRVGCGAGADLKDEMKEMMLVKAARAMLNCVVVIELLQEKVGRMN